MKLSKIGVFFGSLLILSPSSSAVAKSWGSYSAWEVSDDSSDHSCMVAREHEGPGSTLFAIFTSLDTGRTVALIGNYNWTIKKDDKANVEVRFDGIDAYSYRGSGTGISADGRNGMAILISDPDFRRDFGTSEGIKLLKVDGEGDAAKYTVIDYLNLDGTGPAMAAYNRCLANQRSVLAAEQRERDKWKNIPKDPFSESTRN